MDVTQAKAFGAIAKSRTPEEIKAFSDQLLADSDAIVRYDFLRDNIATMPKPERQAIYKKLEAEIPKYPGMVIHEDQVFGKPFLALRAKMGLFRGVKWDRHGALRLTEEVRRDNIRGLQAKIDETLGPNADLTLEYGPKIKSILQSMKDHQDVLDGKVKTRGSIWEFILSDAQSAADLPPVKEG